MFKFNRLAFEIKVAHAIFWQVMITVLRRLDLAVAYLDDILLKSENPEEYKKTFLRGFQKDSGL